MNQTNRSKIHGMGWMALIRMMFGNASIPAMRGTLGASRRLKTDETCCTFLQAEEKRGKRRERNLLWRHGFPRH